MNMDKIKDELLHKYINGQATDAWIKEVMQWACENPENMKELEVLHRLNDESIVEARESRKGKTAIRRILSLSGFHPGRRQQIADKALYLQVHCFRWNRMHYGDSSDGRESQL